jgi:hypothetical protein
LGFWGGVSQVVSKRGDLEQTEHFKILKPILDSHYPKILQAWKSYKQSVKTLDNLTQSLTTL